MVLGSQVRRRGARTRRAGAIAAALVLATLAAACSDATSPTAPAGSAPKANQAAPKDEGTPTVGGTLRMGMTAEIDGLNPVRARWSLDGNTIGSALFDTLLTFDENRNLVPRLALSVKPDATGEQWTIALRPNVTFHDGSPFDANAVKKNIDARKAQPITGGALEPIESTEVVDPLTVLVKMKTPWFGYDYTLAAQGGYMVAPAQIDAGPDSMKQAIGTGPFTLVGEFVSGQPIKVERNKSYWGDKALLDGITFTAMVDENVRVQALKAHDVDLIMTQSPNAIRTFRETEGFHEVEDVAGEETYAMFGMETPPFDNVHARKALAYATDQQDIVDKLGEGVIQPANGPFISGERFYNENAGYPAFDLEKAREEIEAYKRDTGASELSFSILTDSGEESAATVLQGQWAAAGITAKVDKFEQISFLATVFSGKFQIAMFRNFAYINPDSNYIFWSSTQAKGVGVGSINFGQLKDPELDKALDAARSNPDDAKRAELYKDLTPKLNATVPYIWLYHNDWALAAAEKVGGLGAPQKLGFGRQDAKPWWTLIWMHS
jgi:ABC-type transport system substrate-binding protein